ncbi:hypothetical protein ACP8HI_09055 [Paenibacillus sp. FA6]|uniref:hypothetical protein n=1 Tax=Paenibacillus sp. FA6 TaxID=3413029 RepID=UPI003F656BF5
MSGVRGIVYFLSYLVVVGMVLKFVENQKIKFVLLLFIIAVLISGRFLLQLIG